VNLANPDTTLPRDIAPGPDGRDARIRDLVRRAMAGLTPGVWAVLGLGVAAQSISVRVLDVFVEWQAGHMPGLIAEVASYFAYLTSAFLPVVLGVTAVANLGPQRGVARFASLAGAIMITTVCGMLIRRGLRMLFDPEVLSWSDWLNGSPHIFIQYSLIAGAVTVVAEFLRHQRASVAAMHRAEVDRMALDREMAEARLQVMQAQIEPHFLFNTLANVRRLYQTDAPAGEVMLDNLMRYFTVPRMRAQESDLAREAELIDAYLGIHRIRMGPRLAFAVDFPQPLLGVRVPPMMLLTLVENAIKHGINPLPEGGFVRVSADVEQGRLCLRVSDSGRGFGAGTGSGGGTGLANIRARLHAEYGAAAELILSPNQPRGITATIVLPVTRADPA
jgi:hypothetical protein